MLCYFCGREFSADDHTDDDHVPMRQLYAKDIRRAHHPNLLTLRVHRACHKDFQLDEDYFVNSLTAFASDTYSGQHAWSDSQRTLRRVESAGLRERIINEFSEISPGGIYAPPGKMFKRYDSIRIGNIIWKITRGLFYYRFKRYLPLDAPKRVQFTPPGEKPPKEFAILKGCDSMGQYPGVFDYKMKEVKEIVPGVELHCHTFGYLFWNKIIILCHLHDPLCSCGPCKG